MIKRKALDIIAAGIIVSAISIPALATDAVLQQPQIAVAPDPVIDTSQWGGFYAGISGGYSWFDANVSGLGTAEDEDFKFGGYTGYNFEFDNQVVTGIELNGGIANGQASAGGTTVEQEWDASLRARLGYAFEKSIIYSFAGVAITGVEATSALGSDNETLTGYNIGAGLEREILDGVTARVEYGFSDYGSEAFSTGGGASNEIDLTEDSVNIGLGVKF